jgi:hypothetical protein
LTDDGVEQALRAASLGGVGLSSAVRTAAAAHLASLIAAEPKVKDLAQAAGNAGLLDSDALLAEFEAMKEAAKDKACSHVASEDSDKLENLLGKAKARCASDWAAVRAGRPASRITAPRAELGWHRGHIG